MANPKGVFSPELIPIAWFDATMQPAGWFDQADVAVAAAGGTDAVSLSPVFTMAGSLPTIAMAQAHALSAYPLATVIGDVPALDAFEAISDNLSLSGIETLVQSVPAMAIGQSHGIAGVALLTLAQSVPVIVATYGHAFSPNDLTTNQSSLGIPAIFQGHALDLEYLSTVTQGVPFLGMPTSAPGVRGHLRDARVHAAVRSLGHAGHIYGTKAGAGAVHGAAIGGNMRSASAQTIIASVAMAGKIHAPYVAKGKWGAR